MQAAAGPTQIELAANLGVGQAQISKIERQSDMLISTLKGILEADRERRLQDLPGWTWKASSS